MRAVVIVLVASLASLAGCHTYRDQLVRSQQAFEQSDYDRSLALLRDLERDTGRLEPAEQAQYAYLRGMSDYRIGYRADARHWLALARAYDDATPGVLPADWKARLNEALEEMNQVVYTDGITALATQKKPGEDETPKKKP
jgi:hypothetical protein